MGEGESSPPLSMKVFIATPSYCGLPSPRFLDSLEATEKALRMRGDDLSFNLIQGSRIIQTARNELARKFLETDSDVLFFIDDDLGWDVKGFLTLIDSQFDVSCGAYPYRQTEDWAIVLHTTPEGYPTGFRNWLATADCGAGFLCIRRSVLEKIKDATPDLAYTENDKACHDFFPQGVKNGRFWGEDFAFCELWRSLGGKIWCWPQMTFDHAGKAGNYHEFLMAQPKVSNAA